MGEEYSINGNVMTKDEYESLMSDLRKGFPSIPLVDNKTSLSITPSSRLTPKISYNAPTTFKDLGISGVRPTAYNKSETRDWLRSNGMSGRWGNGSLRAALSRVLSEQGSDIDRARLKEKGLDVDQIIQNRSLQEYNKAAMSELTVPSNISSVLDQPTLNTDISKIKPIETNLPLELQNIQGDANVYMWQYNNGFRGKDLDGKLGSKTAEAMRTAGVDVNDYGGLKYNLPSNITSTRNPGSRPSVEEASTEIPETKVEPKIETPKTWDGVMRSYDDMTKHFNSTQLNQIIDLLGMRGSTDKNAIWNNYKKYQNQFQKSKNGNYSRNNGKYIFNSNGTYVGIGTGSNKNNTRGTWGYSNGKFTTDGYYLPLTKNEVIPTNVNGTTKLSGYKLTDLSNSSGALRSFAAKLNRSGLTYFTDPRNSNNFYAKDSNGNVYFSNGKIYKNNKFGGTYWFAKDNPGGNKIGKAREYTW